MFDLTLSSVSAERRGELQLESAPERGALISVETPTVRAAARLAHMLREHECDLFAIEPPRWRVQILGLDEVDSVLATIRAWLVTEEIAETSVLLEGHKRITVRP